MNWQRRFCCVVVASTLSFFSPSLLAQNCSNNQAPVANAGPDRSGNVGVAINFTGAGTDSDGTITAYWFNFGDGSFASWQSSPLASHSFASTGTFSVRLWVKDNCGAMSASDTAMVTITQAPANPCANNTAPIANAGPDRAGNPNTPLLLTGYASTDVQNNISHYWWNFGDGQYTGWQTNAGVSHAFANTGTYSVRLWVKDSCGAMSAADTVIVSIVNPNPCAGNTPPNAVITSPSSGLVNQSLNFSGLSSSDSTGTIQSHAWNFGDGQSANGVTVSHSYASAGNKTVTLTLTDSCGAQGSMTRTIVISNPDPCAGNQPPVAQASANPASAAINQSISFSAAGSSDPNGSITSYSWNFGDGGTANGISASHSYANTGSFNVILTVTDNCGATATKAMSVSITNSNQAPFNVNAGLDRTINWPSNSVSLSALAQDDGLPNPPGALSYAWSTVPGGIPLFGQVSFGNSSTASTTATFSIPGIYRLRVIVSDGQLATGDQVWITVLNPIPCSANLPPVAGSISGNLQIHTGESVSLSSNANDPEGNLQSYAWNFGDGQTASGPSVNHVYSSIGSFAVTLTVSDSCGATAMTSATVNVSCTESGSVEADFRLLKLTHIDLATGEESWEEIPLPNPDHPVELGLRVKIDASISTGPLGIGYLGAGGGYLNAENHFSTIRSWSSAGAFNVTLTLYNCSFTQFDTITKTIHVAEGMDLLAVNSLPGSGDNVKTSAITLAADGSPRMWSVSSNGNLAVSHPNEGGPESPADFVSTDLMPAGVSIDIVRSLAQFQNVFYVADPVAGIRILQITDDIATQVNVLPTSQVGGISASTADVVCVVGNALYVASWTTGTIYIFDLNANPSYPVFVRSVVVPGGIRSMVSSTLGFVATRAFGANMIYVIDARNPLNPAAPTGINVSEAGTVLMAAEEKIAVESWAGGIRFLGVHFLGQSMSVIPAGIIQSAGLNQFSSLASNNRLYIIDGNDIEKFDVSNIHTPYLMDSLVTGVVLGRVVLFDNNENPVLDHSELLVNHSGPGLLHIRP